VPDWIKLLEGKLVNLRAMEKEDLPQFTEWFNTPEFMGDYSRIPQSSRAETEKMLEGPNELKPFIVEKKDGTKIGFIAHFYVLHPFRQLEIGFALVPGERGKGYCTEAVQLMVDFLFLSRETMRIQATTDTRNLGSQKVLEKTGFKKEGTLRKYGFVRGELRDQYLYSILREEWKEPRILTRK
jgi:ribosomal-protein-alanine N-acetyltransferase